METPGDEQEGWNPRGEYWQEVEKLADGLLADRKHAPWALAAVREVVKPFTDASAWATDAPFALQTVRHSRNKNAVVARTANFLTESAKAALLADVCELILMRVRGEPHPVLDP